MSAQCAAPVSWLRLERYHLGELDARERERIRAHVASCAACAACLARIGEPQTLRPLDVTMPARPGRVVSLARRAAVVLGGLSLAAGVMLAIGRQTGQGRSELAYGTKGGEVAFSLVREDGEPVSEASAMFHDGERFKVLVTCPPSMHATFDVAVIDVGGASFPLAPTTLPCGNARPLPGALRLTGRGDETLCLVWDPLTAPDRDALARPGAAVGERSVCKHLAPAPDE